MMFSFVKIFIFDFNDLTLIMTSLAQNNYCFFSKQHFSSFYTIDRPTFVRLLKMSQTPQNREKDITSTPFFCLSRFSSFDFAFNVEIR